MPGAIADNILRPFMADIPGPLAEKLGARTIEGVVAEGTRSIYTIADQQDRNGKALSVVHEKWYCPELKIVVLETNDDPVAEQLGTSWWASFEENRTSRSIAHPRIILFATCGCQSSKRVIDN